MPEHTQEITEKFLFHFNYYKNAQRLKNKQDRCDFYDALTKYVFFGEYPEFSEKKYLVQVVFEGTLDSLEAARRKYNAAVENGKRGGRPKKDENKTQQKPNETQCITSDISSGKPAAEPVENQNKIKKEGYTLRYNLSTDASADGPNGPQPSAPKLEPYTAEQAIADIKAKAAAREERERAAAEERERIREEQFQAARAERERKIQEAKAMLLKAKEAEVSAG